MIAEAMTPEDKARLADEMDRADKLFDGLLAMIEASGVDAHYGVWVSLTRWLVYADGWEADQLVDDVRHHAAEALEIVAEVEAEEAQNETESP